MRRHVAIVSYSPEIELTVHDVEIKYPYELTVEFTNGEVWKYNKVEEGKDERKV